MGENSVQSLTEEMVIFTLSLTCNRDEKQWPRKCEDTGTLCDVPIVC